MHRSPVPATRPPAATARRVPPAALLALVLVALGAASAPAVARDDRTRFPVAEALTATEAKARLGGDIRFFFGKQPVPAVERSFGTFTSNKKTNAANKSDKLACEWAFLSAMLSFQDRARQLGGNAVINIRSTYRGGLLESETEYECGAGALIAGVTFTGEVVRLKD
jgi:hypothetical protein